MGDEVTCSTLKRWSAQGGAGGAPKLRHHHLPFRRKVVGGARHKELSNEVEQIAPWQANP